MPHKLPAELERVLNHLGIVVAYLAVEGGSATHTVPCHHLHEAEDADAVAIVARRPVDDVGCFAGAAGHGLVQREGLDVRDDPERHTRAIRPGECRTTVDWNICKRAIALRL